MRCIATERQGGTEEAAYVRCSSYNRGEGDESVAGPVAPWVMGWIRPAACYSASALGARR